MPVVNTYYREPRFFPALSEASPAIQECIAEQLSCGDRTLQPSEVSVRLLDALGRNMLADVEIDMFAAPYKERVERQDEICRNVRKLVLSLVPDLQDTQVWLMLQELGHSWEEYNT